MEMVTSVLILLVLLCSSAVIAANWICSIKRIRKKQKHGVRSSGKCSLPCWMFLPDPKPAACARSVTFQLHFPIECALI